VGAWVAVRDAVDASLDNPATTERVDDCCPPGRLSFEAAVDMTYTTDEFAQTWDLTEAPGIGAAQVDHGPRRQFDGIASLPPKLNAGSTRELLEPHAGLPVRCKGPANPPTPPRRANTVSEPNVTNRDEATSPTASSGDSSSRQWRSLWRVHFYSGMFAMPFILLMAVTGPVILYTDPIQQATEGDIRSTESRSTEYVSFDEQAEAVAAAYPDGTVSDLTPPADREATTRFFVDDGSASGLHVFVDPYTAEVLGVSKPGGAVIGLSNRLHGFLNNDSLTVTLPAVAALWSDGPVMREYVVGDLVLEVLGVWTLVLVGSGLYLFWPRRSSQSQGSKGARRLIGVRWAAGGRARWRDLHGLTGFVMIPVMVLTIVSGMAWSSYWADGFSSLAERVTPGSAAENTASTSATRGDLDRFGNQIPWATGDFVIPASYAPVAVDGTMPSPISLDSAVRIAEDEGMKPGYTISFPANETDEAGNPVYGSFTLYNSWPRQTGEARNVFVDQFSGATLDEQRIYGVGTISVGMDYLVSTHMGTQLGLVSRIFMTLLCVLSIWSVISAFVMFWRRRRPGTLGLPRRPADPRLTWKLVGAAVLLGIVYPLWAAVALVIVAFDKLVIQSVSPLRRTFGQA